MRERVLIAACIFGLMVFTGWKVASTLVAPYFAAGDGSAPSEEKFNAVLSTIEADHIVEQGAHVRLAELRRSDGTSITFNVAEGHFTESTIVPSAAWSELLTEATLLVSSGDEILRNNGGISEAIGAGCKLDPPKFALATGAMFFSDCKGAYRQAFPRILGVDSAIIKTWDGVGEQPPCSLQSTIRSDDPVASYSKCIGQAIESALGKLWGSEEIEGKKTLVIPELGSGTANVNKGFFYQAVKNALEKCPIQIKGCDGTIPDQIIFAVWAGDKPGAWNSSKAAIARNLEELANAWRIPFAAATRDTKSARYLGVLTVLLVFVLWPSLIGLVPGAVTGPSGAAIPPSTSPPTSATAPTARLSLVILGWGLVAAGICTSDALSSESLAGVLPTALSGSTTYGILAAVLLGMSATIFCRLIHKAASSFDGV